jgi:hypothetical protein
LASPRLAEEGVVDRQAVGLAVPKVVIDKPEDVLGVDHVVLIVEVLDAPIENEIGREALRIVGIESVNRARTLVDEVSSTGDPVILAIGPVALDRVSGYGRAMLVPAGPPFLVHVSTPSSLP